MEKPSPVKVSFSRVPKTPSNPLERVAVGGRVGGEVHGHTVTARLSSVSVEGPQVIDSAAPAEVVRARAGVDKIISVAEVNGVGAADEEKECVPLGVAGHGVVPVASGGPLDAAEGVAAVTLGRPRDQVHRYRPRGAEARVLFSS